MFLYLLKWLLLYPASGYRNSGSGAFGDIGSNSRCWGAAVIDVNGYSVYFPSTVVSPLHNNNRAIGIGVRCVQNLLLFSLCSLT